MNPGKKEPHKGLNRAIDVLELFVNEECTLGITDIATRLNLTKTMVQGIVNTLVTRNFLVKYGSSQKYQLGPMLFQLGMKYTAVNGILSFSSASMERLAFKFRETVNVSMVIGKTISIVMRFEAGKKQITHPASGSLIPAHATSSGKLLLSAMSDEQRDAFLQNYQFTAYTTNTITSPEALGLQLAQIRERMISFENEEYTTGLAGISGPIYNSDRSVIAAFSVYGAASHIHAMQDEIISDIRFTSDLLSSKISHVR